MKEILNVQTIAQKTTCRQVHGVKWAECSLIAESERAMRRNQRNRIIVTLMKAYRPVSFGFNANGRHTARAEAALLPPSFTRDAVIPHLFSQLNTSSFCRGYCNAS